MADEAYELADRYRSSERAVVLSGIDALVRLPMAQVRRDRAYGLRTGGFISGYRGSPLGGLDLALQEVGDELRENSVYFQPGINEDLAATAVWGTQVAHIMEGATVDGVFAMWYGKGPGVDRSTDALKHGNYHGASPHGGVLVVAGDDHAAKSSSLPHQSDQALIGCGIPILEPCSVADIFDFGLAGWTASRYSGAWIGLRCVTEVIETSMALRVDETSGFIMPDPDRLQRTSAWQPPALVSERELYDQRLPAVQSFVRANGLDRVALNPEHRQLGIVTAGKSYVDVRRALAELDLDEERCEGLGLSVLKLALTWPVDPVRIRDFARGVNEILVVEEKRPVIEDQIARVLYSELERPAIIGKFDVDGRPLLPAVGELTPRSIAEVIEQWLRRTCPTRDLPTVRKHIPVTEVASLERPAAFCAGCPHNASTVVPDGSHAFGGIGCHGMAVSMPDRPTHSYTHMGGEGANWIGISPFTSTSHVFQNMGDGTYFHSGILAVRAAVAAGVNITFKILANGAVAMTGGQVIEGESFAPEVLVPDIVTQLLAEGVDPVVVVSSDPSRHRRGSMPRSVDVKHRDELAEVQEALQHCPSVSAIVYDQTCAAEARRLRKKGLLEDPDRRIVINELVCEGCGDCSVQSNCIAIEPVETAFGRKRAINQSACNKDYSCLNGYCPSFAIIEGGRLRRSRPSGEIDAAFEVVPDPALPAVGSEPYNLIIAGIGGMGVVTIGAVVEVAAHLSGLSSTALDITGLAQKNGAVSSHLRIARTEGDIDVRRISSSMADALICCDLVVSTGAAVLDTLSSGHTRCVTNRDVAPTAAFARDPDLNLDADPLIEVLADRLATPMHVVAADTLNRAVLGDAISTNFFMLGYAFQAGLLPIPADAFMRAIELNGVAVDQNKRAFEVGRLALHAPEALSAAEGTNLAGSAPTLDEEIERRFEFLTAYQNAKYATSYRRFVEDIRVQEMRLIRGERVTASVVRNLFKLMSYKDEYEVARLYTGTDWTKQLNDTFDGKVSVKLNLAPQILMPRNPRTGRVKKRVFGPWVFPAFKVLRRMKGLRGTPFDPFGQTTHRRRERMLIEDYRSTIGTAMPLLTEDNLETLLALAEIPDSIRGYGLIKDESIDRAEVRREELLGELGLGQRSPATPVALTK
jgi:indolepyruvate ferredoxin oxidoreductase